MYIKVKDDSFRTVFVNVGKIVSVRCHQSPNGNYSSVTLYLDEDQFNFTGDRATQFMQDFLKVVEVAK